MDDYSKKIIVLVVFKYAFYALFFPFSCVSLFANEEREERALAAGAPSSTLPPEVWVKVVSFLDPLQEDGQQEEHLAVRREMLILLRSLGKEVYFQYFRNRKNPSPGREWVVKKSKNIYISSLILRVEDNLEYRWSWEAPWNDFNSYYFSPPRRVGTLGIRLSLQTLASFSMKGDDLKTNNLCNSHLHQLNALLREASNLKYIKFKEVGLTHLTVPYLRDAFLQCPNLRGVSFSKCDALKVADIIELLRENGRMTSLELRKVGLELEPLDELLRGLPQLETFRISGASFSPSEQAEDFIQALESHPKLRMINLERDHINPALIEELMSFHNRPNPNGVERKVILPPMEVFVRGKKLLAQNREEEGRKFLHYASKAGVEEAFLLLANYLSPEEYEEEIERAREENDYEAAVLDLALVQLGEKQGLEKQPRVSPR